MKGTLFDAEKYEFSLTTPTLSIVDRDNKVHINLARERLTQLPEAGLGRGASFMERDKVPERSRVELA